MKKNLLIPLIWLLIYPVVMPASLSNYVLCIGADGHVEFEIEANGRCTDVHPSHSKHTEDVFTDTVPQEHHCGSCIDLPIFFSLNEQPHLVPYENIPLNQLISLVAISNNPDTPLRDSKLRSSIRLPAVRLSTPHLSFYHSAPHLNTFPQAIYVPVSSRPA